MTELATVRLDKGGVNRRILARQAVADYRRVEQASIKQRVCLHSPEAKRFFVRFFHSLQLNAHFVSNIARAHLSREDVESVEQTLRKRLDELMAQIDQGIDGAHALFAGNGITGPATYDTMALDLEVGIISSFGRRYLEAIQALDQLMPMLQTLEIYDVVLAVDLDAQRASYKKSLRRVVTAARELGNGLRKRMNEQASKEAGGDHGRTAPLAGPPGQARVGELREEGPQPHDVPVRQESVPTVAAEGSIASAPVREEMLSPEQVPPPVTSPVRQGEERRAA
ncbi:MAG TPA: DUF1845 domain-containing protein [Burkholderiaceae bacterium]|nr:DUF1845 domain-containing protein [Burkholderiaceae bacterium]